MSNNIREVMKYDNELINYYNQLEKYRNILKKGASFRLQIICLAKLEEITDKVNEIKRKIHLSNKTGVKRIFNNYY